MPKSNRKRAKQALVDAEKAEVDEVKHEEKEGREEASFTESQVEEMRRDVFVVLELGEDGVFRDVTGAHRAFVDGIQGELQKGTSNVNPRWNAG